MARSTGSKRRNTINIKMREKNIGVFLYETMWKRDKILDIKLEEKNKNFDIEIREK